MYLSQGKKIFKVQKDFSGPSGSGMYTEGGRMRKGITPGPQAKRDPHLCSEEEEKNAPHFLLLESNLGQNSGERH